jgi:prevent-host-death family protein
MQVNVTELRQNLPKYLKQVEEGAAIEITSHGKVIAQLIAPVSERERAEQALAKLRSWGANTIIGDIESPSGEVWNAEQGIL